MPKTKFGKWSISLAAAMLVLIFTVPILDTTFYKGVEAGDTIIQDLNARPLIAIPMLLGMLSGVLALVTGLIAIIKHQERAILVYISTAIGALLLLLIIGDTFSAE